MSGDEELQDALRRLARAAPREAGGAVDRELRARFRARRKKSKRMWTYAGEIAALAIALAGLYLGLMHGGTGERRSPVPGTLTQVSGFIMLPYAQSDVPMEQAVIVRVKISVSELGAIGVPLSGAPRGVNVSADLLVGQDGIARAVRLVE